MAGKYGKVGGETLNNPVFCRVKEVRGWIIIVQITPMKVMKGAQDLQQLGQNGLERRMTYENNPDGQSIQEGLRKGPGW